MGGRVRGMTHPPSLPDPLNFTSLLITKLNAQVEKLWEHAFYQRLRAVPSERPVLCAEASWSTAKERRRLMELMFEKFGVPAMFPAKNAMLSAFSAGRATALVRSGRGL